MSTDPTSHHNEHRRNASQSPSRRNSHAHDNHAHTLGHHPEGHGDPLAKKAGGHHQQGHGQERTRRLSQHSKETSNTGVSHHSHHVETGERHRRISQYSFTTEGGDNHDRHRRVSQYSRDGFLRKGPGRNRSWHRREHDWHSVATSGDLIPPVEYENTYKLNPDVTFVPEKVKAIIKAVLQENLEGQSYEKHLMGSRCLVLSDIIKEKVRQLNLSRFKIVSVVLIGEKKNQSMMVSSRCLWNASCDNFATCEYSQGNICAVGMVFAVYQE